MYLVFVIFVTVLGRKYFLQQEFVGIFYNIHGKHLQGLTFWHSLDTSFSKDWSF